MGQSIAYILMIFDTGNDVNYHTTMSADLNINMDTLFNCCMHVMEALYLFEVYSCPLSYCPPLSHLDGVTQDSEFTVLSKYSMESHQIDLKLWYQ